MLTSEFFEDYPLYRKFKIKLPTKDHEVQTPAIRSFCPVCNSINTFTASRLTLGMKHKGQTPPPADPSLLAGKVGSVQYVCASCKDYYQFFHLYFDENLSYVLKTGQFPSWSVPIGESLSAMLGEYKETYQKGVLCEAHGYGIGAYAYYRRIVECTLDRLLNAVYDILAETDKASYKHAFQEIQKGIIATEKIALVSIC